MKWTVSNVGLIVGAGLSLSAGGAVAQGVAPAISLSADSQDASTKPPEGVASPLEGEQDERVYPNVPIAPAAPEAEVPQDPPPVVSSSEPTAHAPESDVRSVSVMTAPSDEVAATTTPVPASNLSDHEASGRIGFGVGVLTEPAIYSLFANNPETDEPSNTGDEDVAIPALIGRYWFGTRKSWALELGLSYVNGNIVSNSSSDVDAEYFYVRLGAPIAFAHTKHTAFEVIPQLSFAGGASGWKENLDAPNPQEQAFTFSQ